MHKFIKTCLLLLLLFQSVGRVSASETWTMTGSMSISRARHTLTLLRNGTVLAAGGLAAGNIPLASAELYNPTTGLWTMTGSMSTARSRHTATLLLDGRVLIAGGKSASGSLTSAEIYDPVTGIWQYTGSIAVPRDNHEAILLRDGRVLVVGGVSGTDGGTPVEKSTEIYDPNTGTWSETDHMANSRYLPKAVLRSDGRVLVTGGYNTSISHTPMNTAEVYDPLKNRWTVAATMKTARATHAATLLPDGKVLVAGGWTYPVNANTPTASAEIYDPAINSWSPTQDLRQARADIDRSTVTLPDGDVLIVGGIGINGALAPSERYGSQAGTWILAGDLNIPRNSIRAILLADRSILAAGGSTRNGPVGTSEIYEP